VVMGQLAALPSLLPGTLSFMAGTRPGKGAFGFPVAKLTRGTFDI
jgi:hypothetical protein